MTDRKNLRTDMDDEPSQEVFESAARETTGSSSARYQGVDEDTLETVIETDNGTLYMDLDDYGKPFTKRVED